MQNDNAMKLLPSHWTQSPSGGMICSNHPTEGGIIDFSPISGEWFVIFNDVQTEMLDHYATRIEAVEAFLQKLQESS